MQTKSLADLNKLTKADLIAGILKGVHDTEREVSEDGPHGQVKRVDASRERLTGKMTSRQTTTWAYFANGDVDEITTIETDGTGKETSKRTVKHFTNGRQPEMRG